MSTDAGTRHYCSTGPYSTVAVCSQQTAPAVLEKKLLDETDWPESLISAETKPDWTKILPII